MNGKIMINSLEFLRGYIDMDESTMISYCCGYIDSLIEMLKCEPERPKYMPTVTDRSTLL